MLGVMEQDTGNPLRAQSHLMRCSDWTSEGVAERLRQLSKLDDSSV